MTELVSTVGHGLAAVAYLVLVLVLLAGWRGRSVGLWLIIAVTTTAAWAALAAFGRYVPGISKSWFIFADHVLLATWLIALGHLAASVGLSRLLVAIAYTTAAAGAGFAVAIVAGGAGLLAHVIAP